jgi:hypothetical protein
MPRRRKRTTNRVRQEDRSLRVRGTRRDIPDTKKLSRAFIGLALARAQAEAQAQAEAEQHPRPKARSERSTDTPPEASDDHV